MHANLEADLSQEIAHVQQLQAKKEEYKANVNQLKDAMEAKAKEHGVHTKNLNGQIL